MPEGWAASIDGLMTLPVAAGAPLKVKTCPNPVAKHYALGQDFALQGTPAIITSGGELIGGYMTPVELARQLQKSH